MSFIPDLSVHFNLMHNISQLSKLLATRLGVIMLYKEEVYFTKYFQIIHIYPKPLVQLKKDDLCYNFFN